MNESYPLQQRGSIDPRMAGPKPPFNQEKVTPPGLVAEINPKPDHGEHTYTGSGRLQGRKALITGADSGIGRAVAIAFAREGADVALNFLPEEIDAGREVAQYAEDAGRKAVVLPGDLQDEAFNVQLVNDAAEQLGGLDILVFVAGVMPTIDGIEDFTTEQLDRVLHTNIHTLFWATKAAMPYLKPGASIITTSSVQGFTPSASLAEYAVAKAGIANWTRARSAQLIEKGIRVNGIAPGPVWTPLQPASVPNEKLEQFGGQSPMKRPGQP